MVLQNIFELEVLLTKSERITQKTEKPKILSKKNRFIVQISVQYKYLKHEFVLKIYNFIFNL